MAQLVARLVRIEKVRGSNPLSSTTFSQFRAVQVLSSSSRPQCVRSRFNGSVQAVCDFVQVFIEEVGVGAWVTTLIPVRAGGFA